jgi:hypothetical protein
MTKKQEGRAVKIEDDNGARSVTLKPGDFIVLKRMAGGEMQIAHCKKEYERMRDMGLVRHRFHTPPGQDWPIALVELTPAGNQVLAQEFA